ncbi:MAG: presenilin family intramembrane aspartyl protease [Nanoarchaeota archaeon]
MKHTLKVTLVILAMFLITQIIGLAVIKTYTTGWHVQEEVNGQIVKSNITREIPYGLAPPEAKPEVSLVSIVIAIVVATILIILLTRVRATMFIKVWFAFVVLITLAVTFATLIHPYIALAVAAILTYIKIWRRDLIVHNATELLIYPGLATIFVPILNIFTTILLLLLLSVYDFYAVIKSKHMIEMAKFQMKELKIFTGFFLPYAKKEDLEKLRKIQELEKKRLKEAKAKGKKLKEIPGKEKIKVNVAILGGGDVAFPLIFAGVVLNSGYGFLGGLIIALFSTLALFYLLLTARKGKFYPAMPFISAGSLIGFLIVWFLVGVL